MSKKLAWSNLIAQISVYFVYRNCRRSRWLSSYTCGVKWRKEPTSSATVKFERKRQKLNHVVTACKRRGPPVPEIWKHTRKPSKLVGSNKVTCKARLSFSGASWEVAINFSTWILQLAELSHTGPKSLNINFIALKEMQHALWRFPRLLRNQRSWSWQTLAGPNIF